MHPWMLACVLAPLAGLAGYGCARHALDTTPEASAPGVNANQPVANKATAMREDALGLGRIADLAMPAVVSVASTHVSEAQGPGSGLPFDDPFFRHFFGPGLGPSPKGGEGAPRTEHGLGSGVLVTGNVILTNAHVVEGAKTLVVTTQDRRNLEVEVAGADPKSDLAVLRIKSDTKGSSSSTLRIRIPLTWVK